MPTSLCLLVLGAMAASPGARWLYHRPPGETPSVAVMLLQPLLPSCSRRTSYHYEPSLPVSRACKPQADKVICTDLVCCVDIRHRVAPVLQSN